MIRGNFPNLGFGLGLRSPHFAEVLAGNTRSEWFEVITENYLGLPGIKFSRAALGDLLEIRSAKPITMHGVSLSLGGTDPLNSEYLKNAKELFRVLQPAWVSDHLCWTGIHGRTSHELLPLPYTEESIAHVVRRIQYVQDYWQRQLVVENLSSYAQFLDSEMTEWEFLREIVRRSGCGFLLDVNNIYVSSRNHAFDPFSYLENTPWESVAQIHLAGHTDRGPQEIVADTHDEPVRDEVWALYAAAIEYLPNTATMIERDENIPALEVLESELDIARKIHGKRFKENPRPVL